MFRLGLILLAAAVCSNALWGAEKKRLTPMRIAALASSTKEGPEKPIAVEFSGFDLSETSKITITPGQGQMVLEKTRDVRAPIDFKQPAFFDDPDHQASPVVPGTPTAFETIKAGGRSGSRPGGRLACWSCRRWPTMWRWSL